jgi:hypothetical protein
MAIPIPFASERAQLRNVLNRLRSGSAGSPTYMDGDTVDQLVKLYGPLSGGVSLRDDLSNQPLVALLNLLLSPVAGLIAYAPDLSPVSPIFDAIESFAIAAGSSIDNTGATVINGNVALSPGAQITGFPPGVLNGTLHINDPSAIAAQLQIAAGYIYFSTIGGTIIGPDIGGATITPGFYASAGDLTISGSNLTLVGGPSDVFVFRVATDLLVQSVEVVLTGGVTSNNVFWAVADDVFLSTNSVFSGTILGTNSIVCDTGCVVNGRLASRFGTVSLGDSIINLPIPL